MARFAKPLDAALIERLAREHEVLITVEEGAIGGFASHVLHHLAMPACSRTASRCGRWCCPTASSTTTRPPCNIRGRSQRSPDRRKGDGALGRAMSIMATA